ncbi:MAG TPA: DegT/DnrJ/EryC1/StrS family aminotransferase [Ktedonobacteraceae bacterium]|nr:DegT/DnrJ/EryC1/StrS family aminotransferase [Ktedonobacteraceae bacterium]
MDENVFAGFVEEIAMIPVARPLVGTEEAEAVLQVLASGQLAQGERVMAFEQQFAKLCHVQEAVAVSSGTAALYLALLAHGIGAGDEVITTAFSFVATANAILHAGARPVFVDIDPETYTLDSSFLEAALTPRTRAILPVHLYGHPCDMRRLLPFARKHGLALIEDACQAHGAQIDGVPVGSFGTGCFSFYATKNMTTGEGGMITTNDPAVAEHARLLRNHGQQIRYYQTSAGYNLRMTEIQAAIGLVQLEKLGHFTRQRITNAAYLTERLRAFVQTPSARPGYRHVYHQYTIQVPGNREEWMRQLRARGIETNVHYPLAIHQQPFYRANTDTYRLIASSDPFSREQSSGDSYLLTTERAAEQVLSLPVHPGLNEEDLLTITKEIAALCV